MKNLLFPIILILFGISGAMCTQLRPAHVDTSTSLSVDTLVLSQETHYTVEDTVTYQIGGKLYDEEFLPEDSITVLKAVYQGDYREYHILVHDTCSRFHTLFTTEYIDAAYTHEKEYYAEQYRDHIAREDSIEVVSPLPREMEDLKGYWIWLWYYPEYDDYFLHHYMGDLHTHHLSEYYTHMYMDGPLPEKITSFSIKEEGDFTVGLGENHMEFVLVEADREVYRMPGTSIYCTPARNVNKFRIVLSVNNTGDLI
ncbi:MAG: hypothetical protein LUF04_15160 [Bacteroides sp.]|nr:hypothetical protein [Bacteroides sp.]